MSSGYEARRSVVVSGVTAEGKGSVARASDIAVEGGNCGSTKSARAEQRGSGGRWWWLLGSEVPLDQVGRCCQGGRYISRMAPGSRDAKIPGSAKAAPVSGLLLADEECCTGKVGGRNVKKA
jgi:hypothetical protein